MTQNTENSNSLAMLKGYVERIELLEEEKQARAQDVKEVYGEAKAMGFDTKILRKVVAARKRTVDELADEQAIFETYCKAIGLDFML